MESVNPATGQQLAVYGELSAAEVDRRVDLAASGFEAWRRTPVSERAALVGRAGDVLREGREEFARLMTLEMGKPLTEALAEVDKCAWVCDYYAANGAEFLADVRVETDAAESFVAFEPLGAVLAVMPWNFPFWQVFRFAAPALVAGNSGVLKHASNVPGCALAIEQVFQRAGAPEGVFTTLLIGSGRVASLIADDRIAAVTVTGSTGAGRSVAAAAGAALKKSVLELGGSDPYVILEDADLEAAVDACVTARLINSGQSCIAAKRFVVVEAVRSTFEQRLKERMAAARVGDPMDVNTDVGPLARRELRDELHSQVATSIAAGARLLLGGVVPEGPGAYYPPTVLTDVPPGCPAYGEELFGPVAAIIPVRDEAEALFVANDTSFGLGAAVFTSDTERGRRIARSELHAGCCFVNTFVRSDPRLPFGGVKASGFGRELSVFGIREFVNIKTIYVA
jgi:succinate-semialdehyde dehydrogenase/glutarate-semialdehyde dehydrogenase